MALPLKGRKHRPMYPALPAWPGFYACNDSTVTPAQTDNLSLNVMSTTDSAGDSQSYFIIDTVKILMKDIKLNVSNSSQDSTNFKTGPFVLFLNLSSGINEISTSMIPAGSYDKIKFEIHKLNNKYFFMFFDY